MRRRDLITLLAAEPRGRRSRSEMAHT